MSTLPIANGTSFEITQLETKIEKNCGVSAPLGLPPTDTISKAPTESPTYPVVTPSTLLLADAKVPLFDLDAIEKLEGVERVAAIKEFVCGLEDVGFVAVKAEALTPFIENVHAAMEKYFSRTLEEKMRDWNPIQSLGFSNQGRETAAGNHVADLKETFFIPPGFSNWPTDLPEFQAAMEPYRQKLTEIAVQVMRLITESLNEPTEEIASSINTAYNLLRLAYYPAPSDNDHPQAVWAAEHEDLNAVTLLPPSTVPGLQLLTKEGVWKAVIVPQGYLIVNTGEQLERKTAGVIRATRHRVLNPGGEYAYQSRYASIFFASWPPEFSLNPFIGCVDRVMNNPNIDDKVGHLKRYGDVSVQENLDSRLIEMGVTKNPPEELVVRLLSKNLLQKPPRDLINRFPHLF